VSRRLLTCGEHAVLVEVDGLEEVLALDDAVRAAVTGEDAAFADVVDVVPAARTLLVVVHEGADVLPVRKALSTLPADRPTSADALRRCHHFQISTAIMMAPPAMSTHGHQPMSQPISFLTTSSVAQAKIRKRSGATSGAKNMKLQPVRKPACGPSELLTYV